MQILDAAAEIRSSLKVTYDLGGSRYLRTGRPSPTRHCRNCAASRRSIWAIGHPDIKPGILGACSVLRNSTNTSICVRSSSTPVESPIKNKGPKEIDYCVVRRTAASIRIGGISRKGTQDEAMQQMMYTYDQARRLRYAFDYARKNGKKARGWAERHPGAVGKSNV